MNTYKVLGLDPEDNHNVIIFIKANSKEEAEKNSGLINIDRGYTHQAYNHEPQKQTP